ncbi:MAG: CoB--CoM heterodisulfide reductase iron-sulfur subunit B family protein [Candidatus Lokiarchaeota archaeon]|nr:CoB--CoM heterodisulfide reductase iron-sulfur subunit B family protein [Candidatus Harpocratesius repetitus]
MESESNKSTEQTTQSLQFDIFVGCTIQNRIPFIEKSARFVFEKLGIKLYDNNEFGCCPDPVGVQSTNHETWLTLGARNLSLAEQDNRPIVSFCNGCSETLKAVRHELLENPEEKSIIQSRLKEIGREFNGTSEVNHFIEVLYEQVGIDPIKELVVKPLTGIKIAVHPGCHYSRPHELVNTDDGLEPIYPKKILEALGATVLEYQEELMCCGSAVARVNEDAANGMLKRKYSSIQEAGADIIAVICPSCFQQLEVGQRAMKKAYKMDVKIPVLYVTELMALAFGASISEIGLKFHQVKPIKTLKAFGFE